MEPIEFYIIIKIIIPTCCLILSLINLHDETKRTKNLKTICEQKGWQFSSKGEKAQLNNLLHFHLFSFGEPKTKQIRNLIYNKTGELNSAVFDFYTNKSRRLATTIYFRCPNLDLPNFNLLRKPYFGSSTFGKEDLLSASNSEFSEKYALTTDDETAVTRLFSDRIISYFTQKQKLSVEGSGDRLIIYIFDETIKPERIDAFLEEGNHILELFQESSKENSLVV